MPKGWKAFLFSKFDLYQTKEEIGMGTQDQTAAATTAIASYTTCKKCGVKTPRNKEGKYICPNCGREVKNSCGWCK